jgi:hypothetical protein
MPPTPRIRLLAIVSLGGVAVTHLMDLPHKLMEAPYLAVLFCGLITASTLLSLAMAGEAAARPALLASGVLSALAIAGYGLSRSVGLPLIEDHVGDWLAPAGVASLVFEGALVWLAAGALRRSDSRERAIPARGPRTAVPAGPIAAPPPARAPW